MRLPSFLRQRAGRRRDPVRRRLMESAQLAIRRLEERRVLDVSAAFLTGTGELSVAITNTADTASLSVESGELVIRDRSQNRVDIQVDGSGPGTVHVSQVQRLEVSGDSAADQAFLLSTFLTPANGLHVNAAVEHATFRGPVSRVGANGIHVDAPEIVLASDMAASGVEIAMQGDVTLAADVTLTADQIVFRGQVDDDGDAQTGSRLTVNSSGLTRFERTVGSNGGIDHLTTDAAGWTELNADITAVGNSITFNDAVVLTSDVHVTDTGSGIRFNSTLDSAAGGAFDLTLTATAGFIGFSGEIGNGTTGDQRLGSLTVTHAAQGVLFGEKAGIAVVRVQDGMNVGTVSGGIGGAGVVFDGGPAGLLTITSSGGDVRLNGAVELRTDLQIETAGGNVTFTSSAPIDSQANTTRRLTVDAGVGTVRFNNDLGATAPLSGLVVVRADGGIRFGNADTALPGGDGPVRLIRSTGDIDLGSGANATVGEIVFQAGDGETLQLSTTGDSVRLNGPVRLESHLSIDTGDGTGDIVFTADASVEGRSGEQNGLWLQAGEGGVFFNANMGSTDPLGSLTVQRALAGVTFGETDTRTGSGGTGPVTRVRAHGGIDLGVGTNTIGGSGIRLNAGADSLLLETDGNDLRLNGTVTLESSLELRTGAGAGDIIITNDAPVDSQLGESHALTLNAGAGSVRVNEDLGGQTALASLLVERADGGVWLGEASSETPGSGAGGPVSEIQTVGSIDLGAGANVISGSGIVVNGGNAARIATRSGDVRFNGAVTLVTDLQVTTGGTAGDIIFTADAPVDSAAGRTSSLSVDAGAGRVVFNEDIGASGMLGSLTVVRAGGGVALGGASSETAGNGGSGPVNRVLLDQRLEIGQGVNVVGGRGIELNGGSGLLEIRTTNDTMRFHGPVSLQSDVYLSTGSEFGDILFTSSSPIDSSDGPEAASSVERNSLTVDAGRGGVFWNANLGGQQRLGRLVVERAATGVRFGGADTPGPQDAGPVSRVATDGEVVVGQGAAAENVITGGVVFNAGAGIFELSTLSDDVLLNGPVRLHSDLRLDTDGGDVTFTSAAGVDGQDGEQRSLSFALGQGDLHFAAEVGGQQELGELRVVSVRNWTSDAAIAASHLLQQAGSGQTTFQGAIFTTAPTQAGLDLTGNRFALNNSIRATGAGNVRIVHSGLLDIADAGNLQLDGTFLEEGSGSVETAGNIITSGDSITFRSIVTLTDQSAADVLLDTTGGGQSAGAAIVFEAAVRGEVTSGESLRLNAGTSGDILFGGPLGVGERLKSVQILSARDVLVNQLVTSSFQQLAGAGRTTFAGGVDANSSTEPALQVSNQDIRFDAPVQTQGEGSVTLTVSGLLEINPAATMSLSGPLRQLGSGQTRLAADLSTQDALIEFAGGVTLVGDLRLDTGPGGGDLLFGSTVNGTSSLDEDLLLFSGAGSIKFSGEVGTTTALGDVMILSAHDARFAAVASLKTLNQLTGTGTTELGGTTTIADAGGVTLKTANILLNGDLLTNLVHGQITLDATGQVVVNRSILSGNGTVTVLADGDVRFGSSGRVETTGSDVVVRADADTVAESGSGGSLLMSNGSAILAGSGLIDLSADGLIQIGQLKTTTLVRITSENGAVADGGEAGGFDIEAAEAVFRTANGVGQANMLDTKVSRIAVHNRLGGGFRLSNSFGADQSGTLTIGEVDGLAGILLGPSNGRINAVGDLELINIGTIEVLSAIQNNAGDDSIFRAEIPGDFIARAPIQNRGGDGWIVLFAGGDIVIKDSLPENVVNGAPTYPDAEISVENRGAIRGEAGKLVLVDNAPQNYAILRTHAERFPDAAQLPNPTLPDPRQDPAGFQDALRAIRDSVSPQVVNVPPLIRVFAVDQGGSEIDQLGRAQLRVVIGDPIDFVHLERNFHLTVDWGDGVVENYPIPGNPLATLGFQTAQGKSLVREPDATVTARFDTGLPLADGSGFSRGVYFVHHTYAQTPNPENPADPITVRAELRYDARREGELAIDNTRPWANSGEFNGIRFFQNTSEEVFGEAEATFRPPGLGQGVFIKVVESEIIPVAAREVTVQPSGSQSASFGLGTADDIDFEAAQFDEQVVAEYRLLLRIVDDITGQELQEEYNLPLETLSDPLSLFTTRYRFPNGHYRIYLEEVRTRRQRLILDVHVYEGRVVPPDFREGAGERQPGAEAVESPPNEEASATPQGKRGQLSQHSPAGLSTAPGDVELPDAAEGADPAAGAAAAVLVEQLWRRQASGIWQRERRRFDRAARLARKLKQSRPLL